MYVVICILYEFMSIQQNNFLSCMKLPMLGTAVLYMLLLLATWYFAYDLTIC